MPVELVNLELEEVSLVDMGDDPLAKVAIFKRSPKGEDMENEEIKLDETEKQKVEIEVGEEEDMPEDDSEDMMEGDKKPTRKSWKAEAQAFVAWRDQVWEHVYVEYMAINAGGNISNEDEFIASLPQIVWP